jgi:AcrR family transcriptional regulator
VSTSDEASYHHGDLRRALIEAALGLLAREGTGALGLREVARAVGVSASAPYRHFRNREALLTAVAREGFLQFDAALNEAAAGLPASEHLAAMGRAYVRFALDHPALFRLMFSPDVPFGADPELRRAADAAFGSLAHLAAQADPEEPRATALAAWSLVHGLSHLLLDDQIRRADGQSDEALIAAVTARLLKTPAR